MKYILSTFILAFAFSGYSSILSDKQASEHCRYASHTHEGFSAVNRSNICGDPVVKASLKSCPAYSGSKKSLKEGTRKGVR